MAVVADFLDFQDPTVGGKTDLTQGVQIAQPPADLEVVGVVDGRFGAKGPPFLVVLFEVRVFVIDMQRGNDALGDDTRPATTVSHGGSFQLALKDQLALFEAHQGNLFPFDEMMDSVEKFWVICTHCLVEAKRWPR